MEVSFHDNYLLAIVIFLLLLCNMRTCCECIRDWLYVCQECYCLSPECLGFRLHVCFQDFLHNIIRRLLIVFCFMQPITLVLISMANQWRKSTNTASTIILCVQQTNHSMYNYKNDTLSFDAHRELMAAPHNDNMLPSCIEIDYLLLCMPHALAVSVSTILWLRLIGNGTLYESLTWDEGIYSSGNLGIFLYDLSYYFEILCMNVFFIFLTVQGMHGWAAYYVSISLTLVLTYFMHIAHYKADTQLDAMAAMLGSTVLALVIIPFFLDLLQSTTPFSTAIMIIHVFCIILIVCGHYVAAGEATAAYVLSLRLFVTVVTCLVNIILIAYCINRLRN